MLLQASAVDSLLQMSQWPTVAFITCSTGNKCKHALGAVWNKEGNGLIGFIFSCVTKIWEYLNQLWFKEVGMFNHYHLVQCILYVYLLESNLQTFLFLACLSSSVSYGSCHHAYEYVFCIYQVVTVICNLTLWPPPFLLIAQELIEHIGLIKVCV